MRSRGKGMLSVLLPSLLFRDQWDTQKDKCLWQGVLPNPQGNLIMCKEPKEPKHLWKLSFAGSIGHIFPIIIMYKIAKQLS